ncbi:MAG: carbohydrate-binding domain-containing protein, partial [Clostridia bacterium]|nr:carbohydrate-binding domain-containing protein [Clostridia bacterium]
DGIKTENTDANKNGTGRGSITLYGGTVDVYAAGDGFQAARDFVMTTGEGGTVPAVSIFTGSYSGYTASDASTDSYKGVKVQNELAVEAGTIDIKSYDDGLHADRGTKFASGETGAGAIRISGGTVTMTVYSPESATGGGQFGPGWQGGGGGPGGQGGPGRRSGPGNLRAPGGQGGWSWGGWGGQKTVSGADAIHADGRLTISGGTVLIDSAYEGLEANEVYITGGTTTVTAVDDGVNATKGAAAATVNVSGGILDVTVSPNGDTDGIDSNGTYLQTGGIVITRGPNNMNRAALDADSSISISGGTLIVLGYGRVSAGGSVSTYKLSLHAAGSHTVKIGSTSFSFENAYSYGGTSVYSDVPVTG